MILATVVGQWYNTAFAHIGELFVLFFQIISERKWVACYYHVMKLTRICPGTRGPVSTAGASFVNVVIIDVTF